MAAPNPFVRAGEPGCDRVLTMEEAAVADQAAMEYIRQLRAAQGLQDPVQNPDPAPVHVGDGDDGSFEPSAEAVAAAEAAPTAEAALAALGTSPETADALLNLNARGPLPAALRRPVAPLPPAMQQDLASQMQARMEALPAMIEARKQLLRQQQQQQQQQQPQPAPQQP